ncbi:MAG TPA: Ig-like domain-containing protein [Verrucomicrobiae bacterium]|nr:Ig-like domain-containing protein [Verrucomicrobiae bacterium]
MGHNLGFPHANFWNTSGQSAIGPGGNEEYGDPFDVMGGGGVDDGSGPGHYVSKFKWRIGWILDADFPRLTSSSTVRIYAHDNPDSRGIRGVRFRRDNALDYFLEFRQRYTGNPWLMNGIGLRWGSVGGSSSQLIDTTPGTTDAKNDSAIVIGRTFSDFSAPVHITPLGLANTYPPSIDVRVNIGPFPGNLPPTLSLASSAQNTGLGTPITLTANASDPNGDELAYWWDFGDGTFSTNNAPTVTLAPRTAGEYKVQCIVSDMKGGTASESIVLNVGAPATFTISGRVFYRGAPLPDVLVKASSTRYAYTDSDGTYTITRLTSGSYTMSAQLYPYTFVKPFFANPVSVGPADAANIDFIGVDAPQNDLSLVSTGSVWRYFDNGTDPGALWMTSGFNDTSWPSGAAQLGYGDSDEATVISYGADPNNKYPAAYFRRSFNVANPAALTNLMVSFLRDDGGIIYLNGVEVLRDNMPSGAITYRTYAAGNSEDATVAPIDASLLVAGNNVLAAEVHQVNATSSDLSFDLSLFATSVTNFANINTFYLSQPANKATFPPGPTINISAEAFSSDATYDTVEFFGDGISLGEDAAAPFTATWNNPPPGLHTLTAIATLLGGSRLTSPPVNITVAAPAPAQLLIANNAVWRYNDDNVNLGTAWVATDYPDSAWLNGSAPLGFGDPGMGTTVRSGAITYYFRKTFNLQDAALVTNMTATLLRDDGAIVYVNGREAARVLMPATTVNYVTLANATVDGVDETIPVILNIPASFLQDGANTVAVEVHQASSASSDVRFGLELAAQLSAMPTPGVRITSPAANTTNTLPNALTITATAVGQPISDVEFYSNGTPIGHDTTAPYSVDWEQPGVGTWTLTAIAYEAGVPAYTSAPVVVTFTSPQVSRQLVSPRSLWRYNDSGSDLGASWTLRTYNDSGWSQGYARLGYGNDGESTVVSYGPDLTKRYITTYFRQTFAASNLAGINGLRLSLARDDGAVVYLNGGEIYRSNMRTGLVSYNSLAQSTVNGPDETNFFTVILPSNRLQPVTNNVLAVELHQDSIQSSDLGFDLALVALANTNAAEGVYLTRPAEGARVTLPTPVELAAFAFVSNDAVAAVDFYSDGAKVAEGLAFPFGANWSGAPVGSHTLTAVARLASGNQVTSPPVHIVVQGPPIMISQVINTLFGFGSQWKYWNNAAPPPSDWASTTYSDAAWPQGAARLGFGLDGENTTLPSGRAAYYFRRTFDIPNPALVEELIFQLRRDDGAVVYINGLEYYRSNMPAGPITSTTLAAADAVGLDEQQAFITTMPGSGLVTGTNVIAVEVHQSALTSSDVGFDLHLTASGDTAPRILLSRPGNAQTFVLPATVDIEAAAWPGQSRAVSKVEFFGDGNPLGERTAPPYVFQWADVPQGNHTVFARMADNFGEVIQSRSVNISAGYEIIRTNFIAAGSVWKYRDINSNEGTNFAQFSYNDSAWASGPAQLGFGDGDEATVVNGGPSGARYITTYFRRMFQSPSAWTITNLSFRLVRDDGAVVWLNGREQYRSNMPGGTIINTTLASAAVDNANESAVFESSFTITNLPATNLVAVEIHQINATSSDISFDLELVGTGYVTPVVRPTLKIVRLPEGPVRITWPSSQTGWTVYSSANLTSGWAPSGDAVGISNNVHNVIVTPTSPTTFYQLRR